MKTTWGPFTGRQLTVIIVALVFGVVALPGTVWAVDSFSNAAIEDPVSGVKASVDASHHLLVGDGSGALSVDGTVYTQPSTSRNPFLSSGSVPNYYSNYQYTVVVLPTSATLALDHWAISNSIYNANTWEVYLFQVPGASISECQSNFSGPSTRRLGGRNVAAGGTLVEDFTTPIVLKPLSGSASWCLLVGAGPVSSASSGNSSNLTVQIAGYVVSGTFMPSTSAANASPTSGGSKPGLGS